MNNNTVYKKVGSRYKPIAPGDWSGFPTDGVWLVQSKPRVTSAECIIKIGDVPAVDLTTLIELSTLKDEIVESISSYFKEKELSLVEHGSCSYNLREAIDSAILKASEEKLNE